MILMILLNDQSFMFSMKVLYDDEQKVCATCKKVRVHTSVCKLVLNFCNFHEVVHRPRGWILHARAAWAWGSILVDFGEIGVLAVFGIFGIFGHFDDFGRFGRF